MRPPHTYRRRGKRPDRGPAPGGVKRLFAFEINPRVEGVLSRIGVPEPRPFVPDPFQEEALALVEGADVLVTAPTGAGKTWIAVKAIERLFGRGRRSWYASPLKALSNAKYAEFSAAFGAENVGILTGDRKENVHAPIIVGTTEILRNQLYDAMHRGEDLDVDLVVLDEAHYLGDEERGVVWEEVLIYLPPRVRLLLLSATIRNASEICGWLQWLRGESCRVVTAGERPVPLFPLFLFPGGELAPLSGKRGLYAKIRTVDQSAFSRRDFPDIPRLMPALREANLLPAIFFLKSRADCEKAITLAPAVTGDEGRANARAFHKRLNELLDEHPFLASHRHLGVLRRARVGAHHGGQLPFWKLLMEKLMQEGYLEAIFSTSTVAAGVNFPARSVVVLQSDRFNGKEFVNLTATDLLQMTGRAGRRGMDEIGFVLVVPGANQDPQLVHDLLESPPDPIESRIRVNFSMTLNLLLSHTPEEVRRLFSLSLATFQNVRRDTALLGRIEAARAELASFMDDAACGSIEALSEVRPQYAKFAAEARSARAAFRRGAKENSLQPLLVSGRVFLSSRGTPYVALARPGRDDRGVHAVRCAHPMRIRRGAVRPLFVKFGRVRDLGEKLPEVPALDDAAAWQAIAERLSTEPFRPLVRGAEPAPLLAAANADLSSANLGRAALPCRDCALFAPCQKESRHPFSDAMRRYFAHQALVRTAEEELWRAFLRHLDFLREEGFVDAEGSLTRDGQWASKLRLDQPLLISEGIRQGVFPDDNPVFLASLIAPFVMDRDRVGGDLQLSTLVWRYPDAAKPYFRMLHALHPMKDRLQAAGFATPPLAFFAVATVYHWALGWEWEAVREVSGMDEGDLAMLIVRTADHLRQLESLAETHPALARAARRAIEAILREPVLMD